MVQASIITIGDELLIGQVIDTNSAWMAQQLNMAGIRVARRVAVGDVWDEIWNTLDEESKHAVILQSIMTNMQQCFFYFIGIAHYTPIKKCR